MWKKCGSFIHDVSSMETSIYDMYLLKSDWEKNHLNSFNLRLPWKKEFGNSNNIGKEMA